MSDVPSGLPLTPTRGERVARNAAILSAGQILSRVLQTVWFIFLARRLGTDRYGIYTLAISFVGFVSIVSDLGVGLIVIRQAAQKPSELPGLLGAALRLVSGLSIIAAGLATGLTLALGYRGEILVISAVAASSIIPNALGSLASVVFQTRERFGLVTLYILTNLCMSIGFGVVALILGAGVLGLAIATVAAAGLNAVIFWAVALRFAHPSFRDARGLAKPLLLAALPLGLASYAQTAAFRVDNLLIAHRLGAKVLALYGVAFMFYSSAVELFFTPLIGVTYPLMARVAQEGPNELTRLLRRTYGLVLSIVVPIAAGTALLAVPIVALVFGAPYRSSANVLRILIVALVPTAYWGTLTKAMIVRGRHGIYIATFVTLLAFVAVGVWIGLSVHGLTGAAAGVLGAHVATSVLAAVLLRDHANILDVPRIGKILVATALMGLVTWVLRHAFLPLTVAAAVVTYGLAALGLGILDEYDRRALIDGLLGPVQRVLRPSRSR